MGWRGGCAAETGQVGADYAQVEGEEDGDLVAPGY